MVLIFVKVNLIGAGMIFNYQDQNYKEWFTKKVYCTILKKYKNKLKCWLKKIILIHSNNISKNINIIGDFYKLISYKSIHWNTNSCYFF